MKIMLNGQTVSYGSGGGQWGEGQPTVVFVHGAGFDHSVWTNMARYFVRQGFNVVAPDLPGHGQSDGPACVSIEQMADWLADLLAKLGAQSSDVAIVGHSMGTLIALAYVHRHPARVQRMVLLGTANPMPVGPPLLAAAAAGHHAAMDMANTWSHSRRGLLGAAANPGLHNFNSAQRWIERLPPDVYHADLAACNGFKFGIDHCAVPTLVVVGEADRMTPPKAGRNVAQQLDDARLVSLPDCGHAMMSEQPNQVLDVVSKFVME